MAKVTLNDVASGYNRSKINQNFTDIESELNTKVLYRDNPTGEPNQMENDLDMNSNDIANAKDIYTDRIRVNGKWITDAEEASARDADTVTYDNTTSGLAATEVQAAIDEFKSETDEALDDRWISKYTTDQLSTATSLRAGNLVRTPGYYAGWAATVSGIPEGGNDGIVEERDGSAEDGGSIIFITGTSLQVRMIFPKGIISFKQFGARINSDVTGASGADDSIPVRNCLAFAASNRGGVVVFEKGFCRVANIDVPALVTIKGMGRRSSVFVPHISAANSYMVRLLDNYVGIKDVGFSHDRSFTVNALEVHADASINRWVEIENIFVTSIKGSALKTNNTVWESTWKNIHARICGSSSDDLATFDIQSSPTGDATNNITFDTCFSIFPHYYGMRVKGFEANPSRKIRFINCMLHGGTDETDLTTFPYPLLYAEFVDSLWVKTCNFAQANSTVPIIDVTGSLVRQSQFTMIKDSVFGADSDSGTAIRLRHNKDSEISSNELPPFLTGIHIDGDSTVDRLLLGQQLVDGNNPLRISDAGIDYQPYERERLDFPIITGTPSVKGTSNWAGQEAVSAATSTTVTFADDEFDTNYYVLAGSNFNSGHVYATGKTVSGFTLNWPTSGSGVVWWLILR